MDQAWIDNRNALMAIRMEIDQAATAVVKAAHRRLAILDSQLQTLRQECDHRNPDGSTAWDHGIFYSSCEICGLNDA